MNKLDLKGKRFKRLLVISYSHNNKHQSKVWKCKCNCGKITFVTTNDLNSGNTKSCGCLQSESSRNNLRPSLIKHGHLIGLDSPPRIYNIWHSMKQRCLLKTSTNYDNYGGRGITVCKEWMEFLPFYNWAMSNGYKKHLTLDRIDNDGDYEPSNCRWATKKTQQNNKSNNRTFAYNGDLKNLTELATEHGLTKHCLWARLNRGWSLEKSLTTPLKRKTI